MTQDPSAPPRGAPRDLLRNRAVEQLRKRNAFYGHLLAYVLVNGTVIVVWAMTGRGFFWPVFVMLAWGVGVVMNAWDVWRGELTEEQIAHEMERLQRHG